MKALFVTLWNDPASVRKFIAALIGAVAVAVTQGLVPAEVGTWLTVVIAFLTALGVYAVHNAPVGRKK